MLGLSLFMFSLEVLHDNCYFPFSIAHYHQRTPSQLNSVFNLALVWKLHMWSMSSHRCQPFFLVPWMWSITLCVLTTAMIKLFSFWQVCAAVVSTGPENYPLNASYKTAHVYAFQVICASRSCPWSSVALHLICHKGIFSYHFVGCTWQNFGGNF